MLSVVSEPLLKVAQNFCLVGAGAGLRLYILSRSFLYFQYGQNTIGTEPGSILH